jgi:hypothetical protein
MHTITVPDVHDTDVHNAGVHLPLRPAADGRRRWNQSGNAPNIAGP